MSLETFSVELPRHAFGPRETARSGDLWRLLQVAAIRGSTRRGWPPSRYRDDGTAFVVRSMTVVHHQEAVFGQTLDVRTWVSTFHRAILTNRQVRVTVGGEPLVSATQEWAHVAAPSLRPTRASQALQDAFVLHAEGGDVSLPTVSPCTPSPWHEFRFDLWHTWMDPLAHANHPAYVDWCDEALCRLIHGAGGDPAGVLPLAERVKYRAGAVAPETLRVSTRMVGTGGADGVVLEHKVTGGDGRLCAEIVLVRGHVDGAGGIVRALRAPDSAPG